MTTCQFRYICGSVLQCVAVVCTVQHPHPLQRRVNTGTCVAVCCSVLQCVVAVCCSSVHCATPAPVESMCQYRYVCCSVLQCVAVSFLPFAVLCTVQRLHPLQQRVNTGTFVAVCCSVLQCVVALCCSVAHCATSASAATTC